MRRHQRFLNYTTFTLTLSYEIIGPILPVYIYAALGASEYEVGILISLAAVASALSRIPSSMLAMRRNALRILILGIALNTVALLGYAISTTPWMLGIFRVLQGITFALNYTLMLSFASLMMAPEEARRSVVDYTAYVALGLWLGPAIGAILSYLMDLRMLMASAALISLIAVFLGVSFAKTRPSLWEETYYSKMSFSMVKTILKKPLLLPTLLYLLYSMTIGGVFAYGPLKASIELGIPDPIILAIFTGYYLVTYITRIALSRNMSKIDLVKFLKVSMLSCAAGALIAGLAPNMLLFVAGLYLVAMAHGLTFPLTAAITAHVVSPNLRILGNSIYLTSWDIGNLFGPIAVAMLLHAIPLSPAFASLCIYPAIALILASRLARIVSA
ncbi:MAG: MFS transporter [Nitrososphaerota archaeon]